MQLAFATKRLRSLCEDDLLARAELGNEAAVVLQRRLADIDAASNVAELPPSTGLVIRNQVGATERCIALNADWVMTFCANHFPVPMHVDGAVDWSHVTRVKILQIERADG